MSTWYQEQGAALRDLAVATGHTLETAVGVCAALSPRMPWGRNLALTAAALRAGHASGALGRSVRAADAILRGEAPLSVLRGPKVRAFYRALLGSPTAVVLDVHMLRWLGARVNPTVPQYRRAERKLRHLAARAGMAPAPFQASVWISIRGGAS